MEEAFYQGEQPDQLTTDEMADIAMRVHKKAEYLEHGFDWVEYAEKYWKFIRWEIEHGRSYDEFNLSSNENV